MSRTYRRTKNVSMGPRVARLKGHWCRKEYSYYSRVHREFVTETLSDEETIKRENIYHSDNMPPSEPTDHENSNRKERQQWQREYHKYKLDPDHEVMLHRVRPDPWFFCWY